jgi:hypothetical protein
LPLFCRYFDAVFHELGYTITAISNKTGQEIHLE